MWAAWMGAELNLESWIVLSGSFLLLELVCGIYTIFPSLSTPYHSHRNETFHKKEHH